MHLLEFQVINMLVTNQVHRKQKASSSLFVAFDFDAVLGAEADGRRAAGNGIVVLKKNNRGIRLINGA